MVFWNFHSLLSPNKMFLLLEISDFSRMRLFSLSPKKYYLSSSQNSYEHRFQNENIKVSSFSSKCHLASRTIGRLYNQVFWGVLVGGDYAYTFWVFVRQFHSDTFSDIIFSCTSSAYIYILYINTCYLCIYICKLYMGSWRTLYDVIAPRRPREPNPRSRWL